MTRRLAQLALGVVMLVSGAHAALADRARVLVLPLDGAIGTDASLGAAFDARLLIALEETGAVTTLTLDEETDCNSATCFADAAKTVNAQAVLWPMLRFDGTNLSVFVGLVDVSKGIFARRFEAPTDRSVLGTQTPNDVAHRLFGAPPGPAVVGILEKGRATGAASAISSRLAALRTFTVVPASRAGVTLTHRAEVDVSDFSITRRRHHIHHYLDGVLVATLTITFLDTNQVIFTKPVRVAVSRRERGSSNAEVSALLAEAAANDWMTAFIAEHTETLLKGDAK